MVYDSFLSPLLALFDWQCGESEGLGSLVCVCQYSTLCAEQSTQRRILRIDKKKERRTTASNKKSKQFQFHSILICFCYTYESTQQQSLSLCAHTYQPYHVRCLDSTRITVFLLSMETRDEMRRGLTGTLNFSTFLPHPLQQNSINRA